MNALLAQRPMICTTAGGTPANSSAVAPEIRMLCVPTNPVSIPQSAAAPFMSRVTTSLVSTSHSNPSRPLGTEKSGALDGIADPSVNENHSTMHLTGHITGSPVVSCMRRQPCFLWSVLLPRIYNSTASTSGWFHAHILPSL